MKATIKTIDTSSCVVAQIKMPTGHELQIEIDDNSDVLRISTKDGGMIIRPVSNNAVKIRTQG